MQKVNHGQIDNVEVSDENESDRDKDNKIEENPRGSTKGRGRPRMIRTELRRRPKKNYTNQKSLQEIAYFGEEAIQGPATMRGNSSRIKILAQT